ncbi:hypothetical protein [Clostridium lundense]|uniref:hypothetical protein n=1 Tax=Clostridium lundense TaxID=319475 RepID=UPI000486B83F|nr:hypothetical protein [Clostridium lundense]
MYKLSYEYKDNIPVFKCNFCGHCSKILESTSHTTTENRGCCWYFPKYTLVDIKNILDMEKKNFILALLNMKNAVINKYSIEVIGNFDEEKYLNFIKENPDSIEDNFDPKLFFRVCAFFRPNGCHLDFRLRPHPCNLYLCRTVIGCCEEEYKNFSRERKDYFSYCNYFNESIRQTLMDAKVNLQSAPFKALEIIENFEMPPFGEKELKSISFNEKRS